jgi:hypothetical protein
MRNYRYTPFNIFSVILFIISSLLITKHFTLDLSINLLLPLFLSILLWIIDYYLQKRIKFSKLVILESIILAFILIFFLNGLANNF